MSILNLDDPVPEPGPHAYKSPKELASATMFESELSTTKIHYQIDGKKWAVDYFNQILGVNTPPSAPDVNIPETSLKYNRVDNLDIYTDSGLPASTVTEVTGTGFINAGFVPVTGDAFMAELAGSRIGIFVLTAVRKEYYNNNDIYAIDYKLTWFADTSTDIYNDLIYKTVRTYNYDRDAIGTPNDPVILADDYVKRMNMIKQPGLLINHYLELFYDKDNKYLRLPTTVSVYVDQLVTGTVFSIVNVVDAPLLGDLSRIEKVISTNSVWDAIIRRDIDLLSNCNRNLGYGMNRVGIANATARLNSYLGIRYLITDIQTSRSVPGVMENPIAGNKVVDNPLSTPDDNYIFNSDFYNQTTGVTFTKLETAIHTYLRGELPVREDIELLLQEYKYWSYLDQYNLIPILILLTKTLSGK